MSNRTIELYGLVLEARCKICNEKLRFLRMLGIIACPHCQEDAFEDEKALLLEEIEKLRRYANGETQDTH